MIAAVGAETTEVQATVVENAMAQAVAQADVIETVV
jgi:hypothetical protein